MKVVQSYSSAECNEYSVFNSDNVQVAYYVEHYVHPIDEEVLETPVFEIYYDYNDEDDEFESSLISENFDDIQEIIDSF
jgi:hypothetical protein